MTKDMHLDRDPSDPSGTPEDRRIRRTRRRLSRALLELALERPFEAITIRDLTDRAGIGYATFFRHYDGIEDLLRNMLDELLSELLALLGPLVGRDPVEAGTMVFRHAQGHSGLYRLLLRTDRSVDLLDRAVEIGIENLDRTHEPQPGSRVPAPVAANHFIRSFMAMLEWWLDHDMPYEPEHMGEIYRDLILHPTEEVALRRRARD